MTKYRIKMFEKAKAQVKSVAEYIKEELHAPLSAKSLTNDIITTAIIIHEILPSPRGEGGARRASDEVLRRND